MEENVNIMEINSDKDDKNNGDNEEEECLRIIGDEFESDIDFLKSNI